MKPLLTSILILFTTIVNASECYHYHIPHYYDLFIQNNTIVFQHTVKDVNKISYVSQDQIALNTINTDDFKLIEQDSKYILFSNSDGYYIVDVHSYNVKEKGTSKIFKKEQVAKTIGTSFFYVNNQWIYIDTDHEYEESKNVKLPKLTKDLQIIHKDKDNRRWLLKDGKHYYSFSDRKLKVIPNLNLKTTQFYETRYYLDRNFLYDENTFYLLDYDYNYEEITANFKLAGTNNSFLKLSFHDTYNDVYLKENDSLIWAYNKHGISLKDNSSIYFYPLQGRFISKYYPLIEINGNVYFDAYNAIHKHQSIDISAIENIDSLKEIHYSTFSDGNQIYKYDYDSRKIIKIPNSIDKDAIFYPGVNFYNRSLSPFYKTKNTINYYNDHKLVNTKKIQTDIKNLTLAYAYDDVLLIEDKEIPNIADRTTMEFLGSTVDVVSGCDGGRGQVAVVINYFYFFKDKEAFYYYYSGEKEMKVIQNVPPNTKDYTNNYTALKELENSCS